MPSRPTNVRTAAFIAALAAGVLAGYELRPASSTTRVGLAAQAQVAQVRTQVIKRTIHIVRHERPPRGSAGGGRPAGSAGKGAAGGTLAVAGAAPRTRTSVKSAAGYVSTGVAAPVARTSGAKAAAPGGSSSSGAVRTTSSGSKAAGGSGSTGTVRTKSSGGGGDGGGNGRDD